MGRIITIEEFEEEEKGVEQRQRGIKPLKPVSLSSPVGELTLEDVEEPAPDKPKGLLDVLNEDIEKNYHEYIKLKKVLGEFDTTLADVHQSIKPSVIANYNKVVNKFNSLIGILQTDIAKRDQIISTQKEEFQKEKLVTEMETSPLAQNLLSGRVSKADESDIKDIGDAFVLGGSRIWQQTKDYFTSALPNIIFAPLKSNQLYGVNITDKQKEKINAGNKKKLEKYNEGYLRSQENYHKWLEDNPQLQPRKEWAEGVIASVKKDPWILTDPAYWGYVAADSAAFTAGIMATTLAVTTITQNPLLGMVAGVAVATPMQTQDLYEDLIASGATPEQAARLAAPVGGIIAAVEVLGDLPILASVSKPFKKLLFKNIKIAVVAKVAKYAMKTPIAKFVTMEVAETLEEVVQAGLQDACVMTVDENRKFLGDLKEIVVTTPMATLPFALFGVSADINTQNKVKAQVKAKIDKLINDRNLRDAIRIQLEEQGIIPKEPKVETLAAETEPKMTEIPKLTKDERNMLEHTLELDEGIIPSGTIRGTMATQKAQAKLEKKGYTEEGYLTKKGIELSNILKGRIEAKREVLREHGIKEELLADDEFVKKAKITELPKADVTSEQVSEKLIEKLEKKWGKEKKLTKKEVLEKVEKPPKTKPKEPTIPVIESYTPYEKMNMARSEARLRRLKTLYDLVGKVEKVNINGKIESLETVIKRTQKQSNLPELEKAEKAVEPKEELEAKPKVPPKPPVPPKKTAEMEEPEEPKFRKDVKIKDVYTIGERTPAKKVKGKIREITGQTKQDKILIAELDILDLVLKGEEKAAKKAFSEGKKQGIFDQKEHFKDIVAKAKEREAQKKYVNKLIKDINKLPTQNVAVDYRDKIEAIKDMYDLKKRQKKTLHTREETAKFIEREMEAGNTNLNIPQEIIDLIKKKPLNDMTIAELEDIHDTIKQLAHIGKTKGKMIKLQKGREIDELVENLIDVLYQGKKIPTGRNIKQEMRDILSLKKKVKDTWSHYWINTTLDEALFERMDGGERGLWTEVFYDAINKCKNDELLDGFKRIEDSQNFIAENKIDIVKFLQERSGDLMLTPSQRVGVYLCSLDEDAKRHIQNAGVYLMKGMKEPYKFTDKDISDIADNLTKEEKALAKHYQEYQLTQEKELDEFDVRVRGVHLKGVKNRFAIQILNEDMDNSEAIELERNPTSRRAYMEEGFRKTRTHRAENVINIDSVSNMLRDIAKVGHYKAYKETEMDINNLLSDPKLKNAIINHPKLGRITYDNIVQWFKDSIKAKQSKILSTSDKALMFLRTSAFISMLGINILSGTKQLVSLCNAVAETNLTTILSGIEQVAFHYNETKQFVFQRDPQMRARKGQIDKIMREWMQTADAKQMLTGKTQDIRMKTLFLIRTLDEFAVLSVWKGSYDQAIHEGKSEKEAIKRASGVMRKTQPAALTKDLPQWFRDGTVANLFSLFQNQINKNQNYIRHDMFGKLKAGKISPGKFAHRVLWGWFLPAVLIGTITRGRPPEDWKELARDIATYYAGGWFFVGSIAVNIMQGYGGWMPAPLSFGEEFVKAATYKTMESKFKHGISGTCKIIGLPYNQPYRTIEGVEDWLLGETDDVRRLIWTQYVLDQGEKKYTPVKGKPGKPKKLAKPAKPKKPSKPGKF